MTPRTNSSAAAVPRAEGGQCRVSSGDSRATEHAPSPRSFLLSFWGIIALLAIFVFVAVTATDPSRYVFGSPVPQIWPNTPGKKVDLFRNYSKFKKVTGLLLGSSRCALLLPEQADYLTGLRFFNGSVYDASTDHYLAMYRLFRKIQVAPPKLLVLGIDTVLLSSGAEISEDFAANYPLSSQLDDRLTLPWHFTKLYAHYLRLQTFFDLRTSIRNWMFPSRPLDTYFPDGHAEGRNPGDPGNEAFGQGMEPFLVKYRQFEAISDARVDRLRVLLQEASADRVDILLWLTPVHPALRAAINRLPTVPTTELRARQLVRDLASHYHARFIDLSKPESFGADPSTWLDAVHVSSTDAQRELNQLLGSVRIDDK
jgi:hypothetical protein